MKNITLFVALLFCVTQFTLAQDNYKRVIINNVSETTIHQLNDLGIDLTCGVIQTNDKLTLELFDIQLDQLSDLGINYNILIDNMEEFYSQRAIKDLPKASLELAQQKAQSATKSYSVNEILNNVGQHDECDEIDWAVPANWKLNDATNYPAETNHFGGCLTYQMVLDELDLMRSLYPNLISVKTDASVTLASPAPESTFEGRTVYYVRISDNPDTDEAGEPETLYQSLIHSREAATVMNQLYFMWYLLENYGSDTAIKNLVDNQALYFIPVFNPDGFVYNQTQAPNGGGGQRKNRNTSAPGSCGTYVEGIDLNRNSEYFWNNGGSSDQSCNDTYMGTGPFSETETQIMRDFFIEHDFHLALNHHSYKNAMLHAYAGTAVTNPRPDEYSKYNHDMTFYNRYAHGPSTSISGLNSGNMNDWMLGGPDTAYTGFHGGASLNSGTGSGKNTMAWTPENGLASEGTGGTYGGFWPAPSNYLPIAKRAMRMNFLAAYYSGKYAKLHDLNQSDISTLSGNFSFAIENLGQTTSDFTLTVTPVSSNILTVGGPSTQTGMAILQQNNVNISYTLDAGIQADDEIEFKVVLTNDYASGNVLYEANIVKTYNPNVVFVDDPDTDILTNWTSSGLWSATSTPSYVYSGSRAITSTLSGIYPANQNEQLQMNGSVNLTGMSAVLIQFFAKWDLERSFDYVTIEGSTDELTWTELCGKLTKPGAPTANNTYSSTNDAGDNTVKTASDDAEQNGISSLYDGDTQDKWNMEEIVIDASTNSFLFNQGTVFLRFNFNTDSSNRKDSYANADFEGFAFDDFKIIEIKIPCDNSNPPTGLVVDIVTPVSAALSWNAIPSATYDLRYRVVGAPSWTTITDIATNSYNLLGLVANTDYEAQIATRCSTTTSVFSSSVNFSTTNPVSCTGGSVTSYPYSEDFESGIGLWTQDGADDIDWTRNSGGTTSAGTGPSSGDGDTWYMYTEASGSGVGFPSKVANFISPCFDLSAKTNPQFSYSYHMFGATVGSLNVQVSTDNGANYTTLKSYSGNLGDIWNQETVDLSVYENQIIKIRFNATTGTDWSSDIAIDNINFTAVNGTIWYQDFDSDTFGNPAVSQVSVSQPAGYVADNTDCDDTAAAVNPGATEVCDGIDNNCDGSIDEGFDLDADGYTTCQGDCDDTDPTINPGATEVCDGIDNNCDGNTDEGFDLDGDGYTTCQGDCDDADPTINPGATEVCDGIDNNCDGNTDEGFDLDGDGYTTCQGDCDDTDPTINPGATEVCDGIDNNCDGNTDEGFDLDGDGYTTCQGDCDDADPTINPGATEVCDGIDNNCDGNTDEGFDLDGDGYTTCQGDCDDADPTINPGATEVCDGIDNNCDGNTDEGFDLDGDGYTTCQGDCDDADPTINPGATEVCDGIDNNCSGGIDEGFDLDGDGYTTCQGDCDDADPTINPGATEVCDGIDNNCDGNTDEGFDLDGDGYTTCQGDCDDADPTINPGATEVCDGIDNNCSGGIDEGFDLDGDGYTTCQGDCDDADPTINPGATEVCDGIDNNCDGNTDEGFDLDGDGYTTCQGDCDDADPTINPGATEVCDGIDNNCSGGIDEGFDLDADGYTTCQGDCDDADPTINPGATEVCDGIDNNCDGNTDEGFDLDGDGYTTCQGDCDDADPTINPGATEVCDGIDNNCDDSIDEGFDLDGDGYTTCQGDCDDADPTINPGATEVCDGIDNNCSGGIDEGFDLDGDGYTTCQGDCDDADPTINPGATEVCDGIDNNCSGGIDEGFDLDADGYTTCQGDCDDTDPTINPGATEVCDGIDNNCSGGIDEGFDLDADGYTTCQGDCDDTDPTINPGATEVCDGIDNNCSGGIDEGFDLDADGYTTCQGDCDDTDPTINPGATEVCDGIDNNCDGSIDEGFDLDADGYTTCQGDCDDTDPTINPGATEVCDGIDNNCDGNTDEGFDLDGDGYTTCQGDCDDTDPTINPGATEVCDGIDNNCDGSIDEGFDLDGDGYTSCQGDCDDTDAAINPGATEIECNGIDENCNGMADDADSINPVCVGQDFTLTLDGTGNGSITALDIDNGSTDNCGIDNMSVNPSTFNSGDVGPNTVTLTVTDFEGNVSTCDVTVTVEEETLDITEFSDTNVIITPNPFGSSITVQLPLSFNNSDFDIKIFDLNGRIVYNEEMTSFGMRLNIIGLESLEEAPYFIKITSKINGSAIYKKLIKHE